MLSALLAMMSLIGPAPESAPRPAYLFPMSAPEAPAHGRLYRPQPGDLVLTDDHNSWMLKLYQC